MRRTAERPTPSSWSSINLRDKRFNIGAALPYRNWKSILEEIEKCEVVCANCHRRRTARRRGWLRLLLTAEADAA